MRFSILAVAFAVGCSGSGLGVVPDNPDALDEIPDAPTVVPRDDEPREEEPSPYDPQEDPVDLPDDPPADPPPDEPPADEPPADEPPPDDPPEDDPPEDCANGLICVDSFPFTEANSTVGGSTMFDSYACDAAVDESGPERVYQLTVTEPGFLAVTLFGLGGSADIDVHLLQSLDSGDCLDRGHWDAASLLMPGTYFVTADSWTNNSGSAQEGSYNIRMQLTTYDTFAGDGLRNHVMEDSLVAFDRAWRWDDTSRLLYTVSDYTLPSDQRRLWTFDLATGDLLFHEYVSHGSGGQDPNDARMVADMSNVNGSHKSSVGLMRTAETYTGSKGYSMRVDGLESSFNDGVRTRAIVFHGATYAEPSFVSSNGYTGRSWGCPAVGDSVSTQLIDTIKNGTLYMSYFTDESDWVSQSAYL